MKTILTIHGRGSDINKPSWNERKEVFNKYGMKLNLFQFDRAEDPTYESWKNTFDEIDFSKYEKVYANSLGGIMVCKYLSENKIQLKRLVMSVPGKSFSTEKGLKLNVEKIWIDFEKNGFDLLVDEITIIHAKDDEVVPFRNGKDFAEKIGAKFIELETGGHGLKKYYDLIARLIKNGI